MQKKLLVKAAVILAFATASLGIPQQKAEAATWLQNGFVVSNVCANAQGYTFTFTDGTYGAVGAKCWWTRGNRVLYGQFVAL